MTLSQMLNVCAGRLFDHLVGAGGQHTIKSLPGEVVHVLQKTGSGHRDCACGPAATVCERQDGFQQTDNRSVTA